MKILSGAEIAGYMKANQAHSVQALRSNRVRAKLVIIRDSENPVILKYVELKKKYGEDIGVEVEDWLREDVEAAIREANEDESVDGVIVQLPLKQSGDLDALLAQIKPEKDVDGLATELIADGLKGLRAGGGENIHQVNNGEKVYASGDILSERFESATATAINWLLAGYDVDLEHLKIALVGRGRLIGRPLERMWRNSGYDVMVFHRGDDLSELKNYDVIVSATGQPRIIKSEMVRAGTYVVDAGTASEGGVLVGDADEALRERTDLAGITPKVGGVGPLTVTALFEHTITAAKRRL